MFFYVYMTPKSDFISAVGRAPQKRKTTWLNLIQASVGHPLGVANLGDFSLFPTDKDFQIRAERTVCKTSFVSSILIDIFRYFLRDPLIVKYRSTIKSMKQTYFQKR